MAKLVTGLGLFVVALPVLGYVSFQTRYFTFRERAQVGVVPTIALGGFYLSVGLSVGLRWWVVPVGLVSFSLLQLAALHVVKRRPVAPAPPVL